MDIQEKNNEHLNYSQDLRKSENFFNEFSGSGSAGKKMKPGYF